MKNSFLKNLSGLTTSRRDSGLLGLALDGGRLEGVALRRTNGSLEVRSTFSVPLSLDPLTNDPDLVGREIRNHLNQAGVTTRRCVLALPLKWALTTHTEIPEIPQADVESFLQLEAERAFPCDIQTLVVAISRYESPSGQKHATIVGIPRNHVALMEQVLRAAQLRPESFALALVSMMPPREMSQMGVLTLAIGEALVGLHITVGGGVAALRVLEGGLENSGPERVFHPDLVTRETRITLGQLPADIRDSVRTVRVVGPRDLAQQLADEVELRLEPLGLNAQVVTGYDPSEFRVKVPVNTPASPLFSLTARHASGEAANLEFLPPRVSAWQQMASRYSSGTLQRVGVALGGIVLAVGSAFLFQQIQIWRLESQWSGIKQKVSELKDLQRTTVQCRPWTDQNLRAMTVLKRLTEAFPEDGSVTAKMLEVRELKTVTCTGVARDYPALLKTVEKLRAMPEIPDVSLGQTRGQSPSLQFTFSFAWNEGGANAK